MRIIRKGKKKEIWSTQVECTGKGQSSVNDEANVKPCSSLLEIGYEDIFKVPLKLGCENDFEISYGNYITIKCVECGSLTDIPVEKIPLSALKYAYANEVKTAGKFKTPKIKATSKLKTPMTPEEISKHNLKTLRRVYEEKAKFED